MPTVGVESLFCMPAEERVPLLRAGIPGIGFRRRDRIGVGHARAINAIAQCGEHACFVGNAARIARARKRGVEQCFGKVSHGRYSAIRGMNQPPSADDVMVSVR